MYRYNKLTPVDDADITIYKAPFDYVFENEDVLNIGVSGLYGSGKSSVLRTYLKENKRKYITVSLAHFKGISDDEINISKNDKLKTSKDVEHDLEGKIINQIIQQIPSDKVPLTLFKIKKETSRIKSVIDSALIILFIICAMFLWNYDLIKSFLDENSDSIPFSIPNCFSCPLIVGITLVLLFIISAVCIYRIHRLQSNRNLLKRINIKGNEIELFSDGDDSYFDKYLNEVVYLLEKIDEEMIVFEDIDRFNQVEVFERLREVVILANKKRKKNKKGIIRFFYLIKDDIFDTEDRTKFFDFIIPIIPAMDGSNSYYKLREYLSTVELYSFMDDDFLKKISWYIDDYRLLKNICNEFIVFYDCLSGIGPNKNKLLAIVVYKNLFPKDYSDLQHGRGFINAVFSKRQDLAKEAIKAHEQKIKGWKEEIQNAEKEILVDIKELDMLRSYGALSSFSKLTYEERKNAIENKSEEKINELKSKIENEEREKILVERRPLCELITNENIDEVFSATSKNELQEEEKYEQIKRNAHFGLLKYIVRKGYLDTSYKDYITIYNDKYISDNDKAFLMSVVDNRGKEYSYPLSNCAAVAKELSVEDYEQEQSLNYNLFEYLICRDCISNSLRAQVKCLEKNEKYDFMSSFFEFDNPRIQFVCKINELWPSFFSHMINNPLFNKEKIELYSKLSIIHSPSHVLDDMNKDGVVTEYIENNTSFLLPTENDETFVDKMEYLGIKFHGFEAYDSSLLLDIYTRDMYTLTTNNIKLFLGIYYLATDINDGNLIDCIYSEQDQPLYSYFVENVEDGINVLLEKSNVELCDSPDSIIQVLNDNGLPLSLKLEFAKNEKNKISDIKSVEDKDLRKELVRHKALKVTADNILYYYSEFGVTQILVDFINSSTDAVRYDESEYDGELISKFACEAVEFQEIAICRYKEIVEQIEFNMETLSFDGLDLDHMTALIANKRISVNDKNVLTIRSKYAELLVDFLCSDCDQLQMLATKGNIITDADIDGILQKNVLSVEEKLKIAQYIRKPISILGKKFEDEVTTYILLNKYDENDSDELIKEYGAFHKNVRVVIYSNICSRTDLIEKHTNDADIQLLKDYLQDEKMPIDSRKKLIADSMNRFTKKELIDIFSKMNLDGFAGVLIEGKKPRIEVSEDNEKIMEALQRCGYLESYSGGESEPYYKIQRKKNI